MKSKISKSAKLSFGRQRSVDMPRRWICRDDIYAFTALSILLGNVVGSKAMLFSIMASIILLMDHQMVLARMGRLMTLRFAPLAVFLTIHLVSALSVSWESFLTSSIQVLSVAAFAVPFFLRYSTESMARFNRVFGTLVVLLVAMVVMWHVSLGMTTGWKLLGETKGVFLLLPVVVFAYISGQRRINIWGVTAIIASVVVVLFSGERKSYQVMLIALLLMANFRRPAVYIVAAAGAMSLPLVASLDSTGYVERQLDSVVAFGRGEVSETLSNRMREWQFDYAMSLFQQSPLFGIGTRNYVPTMTGIYQSSTSDIIVPGMTIHGDGLRVLVENGIIGAIFWLLMLAVCACLVISPSRNGWRRSGREVKISILAACAFFSLIAFEAYDTTMMLSYIILPMLGALNLAPLLSNAKVGLRSERIAKLTARPGRPISRVD